MAVSVGVTGLGAYLPSDVVTNDDLVAVLDTTDEWIVSRSGIRERRRVGPDESTTSLAIAAARATLDDAGVDAPDAVIVATTTPDSLVPQTAPQVAAALGLQVAAFDVGAGCTGFIYALAAGAGLIAAGTANQVLVLGVDVLTRITDFTDRSTAFLFGDGAAGVLLTAGAEGDLGPFDLGSDGSLAPLLQIPVGGRYLQMSGREIYRHAVERLVASSRTALHRAGIQTADVDLFVGHQANARILEAVAKRLDVPADRCVLTIDRHGNTSAASIPLALADARAQGRLAKGDRVLLSAFGAGLTWGSALLTWGVA